MLLTSQSVDICPHSAQVLNLFFCWTKVNLRSASTCAPVRSCDSRRRPPLISTWQASWCETNKFVSNRGTLMQGIKALRVALKQHKVGQVVSSPKKIALRTSSRLCTKVIYVTLSGWNEWTRTTDPHLIRKVTFFLRVYTPMLKCAYM